MGSDVMLDPEVGAGYGMAGAGTDGGGGGKEYRKIESSLLVLAYTGPGAWNFCRLASGTGCAVNECRKPGTGLLCLQLVAPRSLAK